MFNQVIMEGRATGKAQVKESKEGVKIAAFRLAFNFGWNKEENAPYTAFIDVGAYNDLATKVEEKIDKGTRVLITGVLAHKSYKNKEGAQVEKEVIYLNSLEVIEKAKAEK